MSGGCSDGSEKRSRSTGDRIARLHFPIVDIAIGRGLSVKLGVHKHSRGEIQLVAKHFPIHNRLPGRQVD